MKKLQIIDHDRKTYYYADSAPKVVTKGMTITKRGFHTSDKDLSERGYTEIHREISMLKQMGKIQEIQ